MSTHFSDPIMLDASPQAGTKKWQHIASEGSFAGYKSGKAPFQFTRATFESIIANFRRHPQYGHGPVVPWDYEHSSEHALNLPSAAQHGVPATGWAYELDIRTGPDGRAQLWALSEFVGEAAQQVRNGSYKWSSVAVHPNFIDPISGENRGPTLTSIALTNKPFLQGLAPIAASTADFSKLCGGGPLQAAQNTIQAINAAPGRNEIERADAYLCANDPAHKALPRMERIPIARRFVADICGMASGGVRLSFDVKDLDFEPKTDVSRAALAETERTSSARPVFDHATLMLESITRMPGDDLILKTVNFLDASNPAGRDRPLAERAKVAAYYLQTLKESIGNGKP